MKIGTLFIVPTPIGNMQDMTFRAIQILKDVDIIGAEDTRNSVKLIRHFEIGTNMMSYHQHNENKQGEYFIQQMLLGKNIAIISDAGMPGISDPSSILIKKAIDNNIKIEVIPGATAFLPALIGSGLSTSFFTFIGFLPSKKLELDNLLQKLTTKEETLIFYEAPHRLEKTLKHLYNNFGDRKVAIAREITKMFETYYRDSLRNILSSFDEITLKGEFVIIVDGATKVELNDNQILEMLKTQLDSGLSNKSAVKFVCDKLNVRKNRVYKLCLTID